MTFQEIKARVADLKGSMGEQITKGAFVTVTAKIFEEMDWLVKEVDRLQRALAAAQGPRFDGWTEELEKATAPGGA